MQDHGSGRPEAATAANDDSYGGEPTHIDVVTRTIEVSGRPAEVFGDEARVATERFVKGKDVTLTYGSLERDSYGRLIAWVEVEGEPLADYLVSLGVAHVFLIPPLGLGDVDALLAAQAEARESDRGIWVTEGYESTLHMTSFHANAAGDDRENVNGEYLRVCNITTEALNVEGYRITDARDNSWTFPDLVVPAGHTVEVHSGVGEHQTDPGSQLLIYLGSPEPIWNNKADVATIFDPLGEIVDRREHAVKKATP